MTTIARRHVGTQGSARAVAFEGSSRQLLVGLGHAQTVSGAVLASKPVQRLRGVTLLLVMAMTLLLGCRREAVDEDPERLVREFIFGMQRVHGDQKNARVVFDLLWSPAQKNLTERAMRASALAGRKVAPEEMIAPSRFTLRFEPRRIYSTINGNLAIVTVQGEPPLRETREIRCVREDSRWRVVLDLPTLPPIQKRPDTVKDE
jgi:hypothetical protein